MKVNMPVTDHEVQMKKGTILVTRTDQKGIITYANDAFIEISGFTKDEIIGKNHNVVRHPDMPAAAFEDLWATINAGNPWTALVKNRTKQGDYYWVEANVTPVFKDGNIHEFLSVRFSPSRDEISKAEAFYRDLNAKKAQMRPTGFRLLLKKISEMKPVYKGLIALLLFLLPSAYSMYLAYLQQDFAMMFFMILTNMAAIIIFFRINQLFSRTLESAIGLCYTLASGYYKNQVDLNRMDQIGDFNRAIFSMQVKMTSDLAFAQEEAASSSRIKQALDQVTGNVIMADADYQIIYLNHAAEVMFKKNEADFRKDLPDFNAETLVGSNIDIFYKNPAHQRGMLDTLKETISEDMVIGGRNMVVIATPVYSDERRLGTVVEWLDKTQEVNIQNEIETIVNKIKSGQLDSRIGVEDKEGFFEQLSVSINELSAVVEQVINDIAHVMSGVAEGDLTREITQDYEGTFGSCKNDINISLKKLSDVFKEVLQTAEFINSSSQEIASGNNNLSQRAEQQASSLEETASSMEELTSTVKNNADNAQQANQVSSSARQLAEKGGAVVNSAVDAMQEINESSNKIAEIIGVIDEIAFQTNLLALNASVEAARAGEQGRGFSVVATEVRNLAQRSATAAKESKELIQTSVQKVRTGTEFVNETGKSLNEIVTGVKKVGDIVAEIAAASVEQSQGIEQVNQSVNEMDEITQQNAALAEQASAASVSMSDQSTNMAKLLSFFKVDASGHTEGTMVRETSAQPEPRKPREETRAPKQNFIASSNQTEDDDEWEEF